LYGGDGGVFVLTLAKGVYLGEEVKIFRGVFRERMPKNHERIMR
jgi:hypothetical protein